MRAGSTRPRVEPFGAVPPPLSSTGAAQVEASGVAAGDADVPHRLLRMIQTFDVRWIMS